MDLHKIKKRNETNIESLKKQKKTKPAHINVTETFVKKHEFPPPTEVFLKF